ncbi:MAG: hypothetical protein P8Z31_04675 [Gammaproteobacteria bacterium]|jgi:hypothetical protein
MRQMQEPPDYVARLQAAYGSAVFHDTSPGKADLAVEDLFLVLLMD